MNPRDLELIDRLIPEHEELRRLWGEHRALESELKRLDEQRFRTPDEEVRRKHLQKAKLVGRDRIQAILENHR